MEHYENLEKGRAYTRNLIAFHEVDSFVYGVYMCGLGIATIYYPALFMIPNVSWYLLIGLVLVREIVTKQFKAAAIANGTHPSQHPPPAEGLAFARSVLGVSSTLDRLRWIMIIGGIVMRDYATAPNLKAIGDLIIMGGIALMGIIQLWFFVRVWMWENVVLAAAYFSFPAMLYGLNFRTMLSLQILFFTVGGLDLIGSLGMFLRWRTWARTVRPEPTALEIDNLEG